MMSKKAKLTAIILAIMSSVVGITGCSNGTVSNNSEKTNTTISSVTLSEPVSSDVSSDSLSEPVSSNVSSNSSSKLDSSKISSGDSSKSVSSDTGSGEVSPSNIADDVNHDTARVTSEQIKAIKAGTSYKDIIASLPNTANYGHNGLRQYIVDDDKLLVLRFDNINDVCDLSGNDLLSSAKSYKYPGENQPKPSDESLLSAYGIVIDDDFISCIGNDGSECYSLLTNDAEIVFEDGTAATKDDISLMRGVVIFFDYTLDSSPPQAHCKKVIILK